MSNSSTGGGGLESPVGPTDGGTGITTYTTGDILYASASNTLSKLAIGSTDDVLTVAGGIPSWAAPSTTDPFAVMEEWDDFMTDVGNTTALSKLAWRLTSNGGTTQEGTGTADHPGVLSTGVTSTGAQLLDLGDKTVLLGGGEWILEYVMSIPTLSDATNTFSVSFGFGDPSIGTLAPTDGVWLSYTHSANSGAWVMNTSSNSTTTTANSANTADTDWHRFKIIVNAAGTSASFYYDGVEMTNSPIATNIPTGAGRETGIFFNFHKTAGSTTRTAEYDLFYMKNTLTSSR